MRLKTVAGAVLGTLIACSLCALPVALAEEAVPGGSAPVIQDPSEVEPNPVPAESYKGSSFAVGGARYEVTKISASAIDKGSCEAQLTRFTGSGSSFKIPATVTYTAGGYGLVKLKVTSIAKNAFNNAKGHKLKSVTIGENVIHIGKAAFKNCKKLKKITYQGKALGNKTTFYTDKKRKGKIKYSPIEKEAFKGVPAACDAFTPSSTDFRKLMYKQGVRSAMTYAGFQGRVF